MANTLSKRSQQTFRVLARDRFHLSRKEFGPPQLQDGGIEKEEREVGAEQNPVDGNTAQQVGDAPTPSSLEISKYTWPAQTSLLN
jgi:hypothetical protein